MLQRRALLVLDLSVKWFNCLIPKNTQFHCLGFPSVGKSTLMSKLTGTTSEVGAYEFTTLTTVPGVIQYKGAKLQVILKTFKFNIYMYIYMYINLYIT